MSSPLPVTEDTPPDMLTGAMDLHVVLPNGQGMNMSVERTTPMMDLLVQVTTANKISPGGYVIRAIGEHGVLPYKPSTPIGALDTWTVHIVSKKEGTANSFVRKSSLQPKPVNQNIPFEQTFRLQVNLPRNQLYVSRVSYKTYLQDILREVCTEKNLDQTKYSLFNPENLGEPLDLSKTLNDYKLQRLSLASNSSQPVGLSSVDIMALKNYENGSQRVNNLYYTSHSYDGSVSSGSLEGRSLSPVRSDESSSSPTISKPSGLGRPPRKRRPAPKPPSSVNEQNGNCMSESLIISHSRNSSDSSGYHESSVLSESPESNTNSIANSLPRRSKLPCEDSYLNKHACIKSNLSSNGKAGNSLSRSLSNLAVSGNGKSNLLSRAMRRKEYSASSTSLSAISGKKKKAQAPPPPTTSKSLLSLKEEEAPDEVITNSVQEVQFSNVTSSQPTANSRCRNTSVQEAQKDTKKTAPIKPPENDSSFDAVDSVDTAAKMEKSKCTLRCLQKLHDINATTEISQMFQSEVATSFVTEEAIDSNTNKQCKWDHEHQNDEFPMSVFSCTLHQSHILNKSSRKSNQDHESLLNISTVENQKIDTNNCILPKDDLSSEANELLDGYELTEKRDADHAMNSKVAPQNSNSGLVGDRETVSYLSSQSYVRKRGSEIEDKIRSNLTPVSTLELPKYRKYSEGSLTYSKIPSSFFFTKEDGHTTSPGTRHLIFDSKSVDQRHSGGSPNEVVPFPKRGNNGTGSASSYYEDNMMSQIFTHPKRNSKQLLDGNDNFLEQLNDILSRKFEDNV